MTWKTPMTWLLGIRVGREARRWSREVLSKAQLLGELTVKLFSQVL